jgi:hypothetical protein
MTTIVTTTSKEFSTVYGDEGITSDLIHPNMRKVINQGSWLIAACGEDRVCDVVQYVVKYPVVPKYLQGKSTTDWYSWVATQVVTKIDAAVEKSMPKAYKHSIGDSQLILVTHGKSFLIGETLGVTLAEPYWSIGSGCHIAIGALANSVKAANWATSHHKHAENAIKTAQIHDPYTRGDISGFLSYADGSIVRSEEVE